MDRRLRFLASEIVAGDITSRFCTPASRSVAEDLAQRLRTSREACRCSRDEHCADCSTPAPELRKAGG